MKFMETIKERKQGNSITLTVPAKFHINPGTILEPRLTDKGIFYKFVDKDEFFDKYILSYKGTADCLSCCL